MAPVDSRGGKLTEPVPHPVLGYKHRHVTAAAVRAQLVGAVRGAGAIALSFFRADPSAWEKSPGHVVSEADHAANDFLKHALCGRYPDDGWLSEESEDDPARLAARRVWVVDPIDGTNAFLAGRPEFAVSAALVMDGAPVAAALFHPATDGMCEALAGRGARRDAGLGCGVRGLQSLRRLARRPLLAGDRRPLPGRQGSPLGSARGQMDQKRPFDDLSGDARPRRSDSRGDPGAPGHGL